MSAKNRNALWTSALTVTLVAAGLAVVACDRGGSSPTAPPAPTAEGSEADSADGGRPELERRLEGGSAAALAALAEAETDGADAEFEETAKGGQPKVDICHWDTEAAAFIHITVGQPGADNHLANHGNDKPLPTWWQDVDGDGFGGSAVSLMQCDQPPGFVDNSDDCDDAASSCTDDCDDDVDGDGVPSCADRCWDADGDGYGTDASGETVGSGPVAVGACTTDGATPCDLGPACLGEDCNDADASINPAADDSACDGVDDDCDGTADDGFVSTPTSCGLGECADTGATSCVGGTVEDSCEPGDPVTEICGDGLDNDCDGAADEPDECGCARTVFVSSQLYDGNFGGGAETLGHLDADTVCQGLATGAGLGGTYKAWISGRVDTGAGPLFHGVVDRFTQSAQSYCLVNGTVVANSWADLTDGSLDHPIDRTELNTLVGSEVRVWTNTKTNGTAWDNSTNCALGPTPDNSPGIHTWSCGPPVGSPGDCQFQSGKYGIATSTGSDWTGTSSSNVACTSVFHLYCFEQ